MSKSADIKPLVRLLKFLPSDDVTLMVLKGHLLIEEQLVSILKTRIRHSKTLEEARLTFFQRLCLAKAIGYREENDWLWHSIRKLNSVRNDLAHKVDPAKLNVKLQEFIELVEDSGLKRQQGKHSVPLEGVLLFPMRSASKYRQEKEWLEAYPAASGQFATAAFRRNTGTIVSVYGA